MTTFLLVFPCLAILCAPALWIVLGRPRTLHFRHLKTTEEKTISIIIPARDEEHNIGDLLNSINRQDGAPLEVIVVNDSSTDRTAEIARQYHATVVDSQALPEGWKGKPWACHQGAEAAQGGWLLFMDADTQLEPGALASFTHLTHLEPQVHSVCPYHLIQRPYEELSVFFNVLMLAGSGGFGLKPSTDPALFGQSMLISRPHYRAVGGHETVKDKILENFHLSTELKKRDIPRASYMGKGAVTMRMFPGGLSELWASWQKGFSGGAASASRTALVWSSIWISGLMVTLVSLGLLATPYTTTPYLSLMAVAYTLAVIQCAYAFRCAGSFSFLNALFFPISLIFYQILFFSSVIHKKRGKQTQWKGREVS